MAVKVLRPELAATLGSDRFFREIEVAARLQHPHILPLLDSGEAGGFYFYVMTYVAGESLRNTHRRVHVRAVRNDRQSVPGATKRGASERNRRWRIIAERLTYPRIAV